MGIEPSIERPKKLLEFVTYRLKPVEAMRSEFVPLYSVWNERRGERPFPSKSMLSMRDYKDNLKRVALLRVIGNGSDFEFRIVGDVLIQDFGENFQGKKITELSELGNVINLAYRPVVASGKPLLFECIAETVERSDYCGEVLLLPLGEDGRNVDHLLCVSIAVQPNI